MNAHNAQATAPSPSSEADWHSADIIAALRKAGWSLRRLSIHHGYHPNGLADAIARPWPKGERLIAAAIGVPPEVIWPSRQAHRALRAAGVRRRRLPSRSRPAVTLSLAAARDGARADF